MHFRPAFLLLPVLILTACSSPAVPATPSMPAIPVATSTLLPTPTVTSTQTPLLPTPFPTPVPVEGATTTQLNVRLEPSTTAATLGILDPFAKVQVIARDSAGNWYQILYAQAPGGRGWVRAQYIQVPAPEEIPVFGAPGSGTQSGPLGTITQQVNVRNGPGTDTESLGTLNPQDIVTLTGRNADGTWLQINFSSTPGGLGWVAAAFVQSTEASGLPILGVQGQMLGTGTPTGIPPTPTSTLVPARADGDSAASPAVSMVFSPSGAGALQFTGEVSSPEGDTEDWVQFTPYLAVVSMRLDCLGSSGISVDLLLDGVPLPGWQGLACSQQKLFELIPARAYLLRLHLPSGSDALLFTRFTIGIAIVR